MRKFLAALGLAALLSFGFGPAEAFVVSSSESGAVFNAVGEVSTETGPVAGSTQLSVFINGTYDATSAIVLQAEAGSPGSGAWKTVATFTTGTANARIVSGFLTSPNATNYRLLMTANASGAVVAYLTDRSRTATPLSTWLNDLPNQMPFFDDFIIPNEPDTSPTVVSVDLYGTNTSNTNAGTVGAVTVTLQEGGVTAVSGSGASDAEACLSAFSAADQGALVSDGWTIFEVRLQHDTLSGRTAMGVSDVVCVSDAVEQFTITGGTVAQTDSLSQNGAWIATDPDATSATTWQAVSALADAEGADAKEVVGPTAIVDTYTVLRVEIDSAGNAYFFEDGLMFHAEALAVETNERLVPRVTTDDTDSGANTIIIDYWAWIQPRPTS